jgi:hypothetical protein
LPLLLHKVISDIGVQQVPGVVDAPVQTPLPPQPQSRQQLAVVSTPAVHVPSGQTAQSAQLPAFSPDAEQHWPSPQAGAPEQS